MSSPLAIQVAEPVHRKGPSSFKHWIRFFGPVPGLAREVTSRFAMAEMGKGQDQNFSHRSVLLDETVESLVPAPGKTFIDGTLGGGGHTEALLEKGASVRGIDRDSDARDYASARLARFGDRFQCLRGRFSQMAELAEEHRWDPVDGILLDLGVSSWQLDRAERGFSFRMDGPLDMRMGESKVTAAEVVNTWGEAELADVIYRFGEEKASRRIAAWIIRERQNRPFETTLQLADGIEKLIGRRGRTHPATKTFQALRIQVNDELGELERFLESAAPLLKVGGRLSIISFHSLEDRQIKVFFKTRSQREIDRPEWPAPRPNPNYQFRLVGRRGVAPSAEEIRKNPRSRSARLRVVEKC